MKPYVHIKISLFEQCGEWKIDKQLLLVHTIGMETTSTPYNKANM